MAAPPAPADTFSAAHARLKSAQKSATGAPAYSVYVNRPLGRVLAAASYRAGLLPDQVTYLSAVCSAVGIVALALLPPSWPLALAVSAALVLGYALDAADGQLARLRGGGSPVGEWLDHMIDSAKISALHLAVLVTAYRHFDFAPRLWLLVPIFFAVVAAVHFFGMILVDQLRRSYRVERPSQSESGPLRSLLKIPTDYGVLCLVFLLLGAPSIFFAVYTFLALASTGYLFLVLRKWRGDVAALGVAGSAT